MAISSGISPRTSRRKYQKSMFRWLNPFRHARDGRQNSTIQSGIRRSRKNYLPVVYSQHRPRTPRIPRRLRNITRFRTRIRWFNRQSENRVRQHFSQLNDLIHQNKPLQEDFVVGPEQFNFEVVKHCENATQALRLEEQEIKEAVCCRHDAVQ